MMIVNDKKNSNYNNDNISSDINVNKTNSKNKYNKGWQQY